MAQVILLNSDVPRIVAGCARGCLYSRLDRDAGPLGLTLRPGRPYPAAGEMTSVGLSAIVANYVASPVSSEENSVSISGPID